MFPEVENLNTKELTIQRLLDGFLVIVDNNRNTFVPKDLYQEKNKAKYLDFLGLNDDDSVILADFIELADMYNVYSMSKNDYENAGKSSKNIKFQHASSVLLTSLIKENLERTDDTRVYLNIKDQCFEMMVLKGANLLFDNNFRFKTKEDFLYFLLFSIEQLHLDAGSVPVYFLGMIEEKSKIVEMTSRYVRDIRFKKLTPCEL